jgi:hypothetical protein
MNLSTQFTRVRIPRRAATSDGTKPPDLGAVAEIIRQKIADEFDVYPPNLNTQINQDGSIVITAVNPDSGLNVQMTITNIALAQAQSGQMPAPPAGGAPPPAPVQPPSPTPPPAA